MKKLLGILSSFGITVFATSSVIACTGQEFMIRFGEAGILSELINLNEDDIRQLGTAQALHNRLVEILPADEYIPVNAAQTLAGNEEDNLPMFLVRTFSISMFDGGNNSTSNFGEIGERRFLRVNFSEDYFRGELNEEGTGFEPGSRFIANIERDFASFAIINS